MTAQVIYPTFPRRMYPAPVDRDEHVRNARAVLRSAEVQTAQVLRDACLVLQAWGDATDWLEADAMILALNMRARPAPRPSFDDYAAGAPGLAALAALLLALVWSFRA